MQPKPNKELFAYPLVKTEEGDLSIPQEYMVQVWLQIVKERKQDLLFYDGAVKNLQDWINYIYHPLNHVVLIADNSGIPYHIAWINKFYQGHAFLHHCALGKYNRRSWPLIRDYWAGMKDDQGNKLIKVLLGVTPATNKPATRLVDLLGWTIIGYVPYLCYLAAEKRHVAGMVSYYVLDEV